MRRLLCGFVLSGMALARPSLAVAQEYSDSFAINNLAFQIGRLAEAQAEANLSPMDRLARDIARAENYQANAARLTLVKGWHFGFRSVALPLYELRGTGPEINDPDQVNFLVRCSHEVRSLEGHGWSDIGYIPFVNEDVKEAQHCDGVLTAVRKNGKHYVVAGVRLVATAAAQ